METRRASDRGRALTARAWSALSRLRAALYDAVLWPAERGGLSHRRAELLASARGRVLEIGAGTGLNLEHYPEGIELVLAEPDEPMARRLRARVAVSGHPASVVAAAAERLPFDDASFDVVVATLVLCSVDDPRRALREVRRVLRPGGVLLVLEHVRSDRPRLARWQDRLRAPWAALSGGCRCNRDTVSAVGNAGFDVGGIARGEIPKAPAFLRPLAVGAAPVAPYARRCEPG